MNTEFTKSRSIYLISTVTKISRDNTDISNKTKLSRMYLDLTLLTELY